MGVHEIAAIVLLVFGGFLVGIGWLVGVALLWTSSAWTARDKLVGTLLFPGGLAVVFFGLFWGLGTQTCLTTEGGEVCDGPTGLMSALITAGLFLALLGPVFSAAYLSRRARRGAEMPAY
jgi:hypothetical protein